MSVHVVLKKKIRVDGQEYASLDEVPAEKRDAVAKAIASLPATLSEHPAGKLTINGHEYANGEEIPATLRGIVESALSAAANARLPEERPAESIQPEPVIPLRSIVVVAAMIMLLALIARLFV